MTARLWECSSSYKPRQTIPIIPVQYSFSLYYSNYSPWSKLPKSFLHCYMKCHKNKKCLSDFCFLCPRKNQCELFFKNVSKNWFVMRLKDRGAFLSNKKCRFFTNFSKSQEKSKWYFFKKFFRKLVRYAFQRLISCYKQYFVNCFFGKMGVALLLRAITKKCWLFSDNLRDDPDLLQKELSRYLVPFSV